MKRAWFALGVAIFICVLLACGSGRLTSEPDSGTSSGGASSGTTSSGTTSSGATSSGATGPGGSSSGWTSSGGASSGAASSGGGSSGADADSGTGSGNGPIGSGAAGNVLSTSGSVDKIDLLFMIDNSASMGDKQALLADAIPDMINRLVSPKCVDSRGNAIGASANGVCAMGRLEFPPVHDMHLGIVTSSLGGRGAPDTCPADLGNGVPGSNLSAHNDDKGHLINRSLSGGMEVPIPNAGTPTQNFLAWYPDVVANKNSTSNPPPPVPPERTAGDKNTSGTLIGDFSAMIQGVQEHGCGFEAQNEAWYRFLVQPDPFDSISTAGARASLVGVDQVLLQQRKNFLRPDSLLAVIVVTDENEEVANPMSIGGQGWLFEEGAWPNSPTMPPGSQAAPEGTIECKTNPLDPNCTSCAFNNVVPPPQGTGDPAAYATRCPPDPPQTVNGYLDPSDDDINVRFFHQKQRLGVFAGYPVSRYIRGLTQLTVPDRRNEVDANGNYVGDSDPYANCLNPIFAMNLPDGTNTNPAALCNLTRGPRTPDLVYYAAIAGVPHQLLQARPGDLDCPAGTAPADCPEKAVLSDADWLTITGKDPENYDFTGADVHMLESEQPRATGCDPTASDTCDPINGREWNTSKADLQFACTFPLVGPKDCGLPQYTGACDCADGMATGPFNPHGKPLCQKMGGAYAATQTYGKAYPSIREMVIAHAMAQQPSAAQGVVSSICPIHTTESSPGDPVFGYRPALNGIVNRLKNALKPPCLPQRLPVGADGTAACTILVTLPVAPTVIGSETECGAHPGLSIPDPMVLARFQNAQHSLWLRECGGYASCAIRDASTFPTCQLTQLTFQRDPAAFGNNPTGDCSGSAHPGWCYVEAQAAGSCPQQIVFTPGEPPQGSLVSILCP